MTTFAPTHSHETSRGAVTGTAVGSVVIATAFTTLGAHDWAEIGVVTAVIVVVAAVVFGLVVPRALRKESAGRTALTLAIIGLLLIVPAFWSGLPMVLGAAAALLGNAGRRASSGSGLCTAALGLGALAMVGYLAVYISDASNGGLGFLFS